MAHFENQHIIKLSVDILLSVHFFIYLHNIAHEFANKIDCAERKAHERQNEITDGTKWMKLEKTTLLLAPIFLQIPILKGILKKVSTIAYYLWRRLICAMCAYTLQKYVHLRIPYGVCFLRYRSPGGVGRSVAIVLQRRRLGRQRIRVLAGETFD